MLPHGRQFRRLEPERLGRGHEIGLVSTEKFEHCPVSRRFADRIAQTVWSEACQVEETLPALCIRKDPAERSKGDAGRVLNRIFKLVNNCQPSVKQILIT